MKNLRFAFLLVAAFFVATFALIAQVSINTDGTAPHTSAMLDVKSTTKGLLIPRMTTAQRTTLGVTATAGLMVYDTDLNKFYYHNGSGWAEGSLGGYWTRSGSVLFNTNLTDNVGIGTMTPGYITGSSKYLTIAAPMSSGVQTASLEVKGYSGLTYNPVAKIDFLSHAGTGTIYNIGRIESRITNAQFEGELLFFTNGGSLTEKMRIDKDGNVGIGTTTPARIFEVKGTDWRTVRVSSTTAGAGIELVGTATTDWAVTNWNGALYFETSEDDFATRATSYYFLKTVFRPWTDNSITLGASNARWSTIYGTNASFSGTASVGTQTYMGNLHVHEGTGTMASIYLTPSTTVSGDSSKIFLGEDASGYYGMFWQYDGTGNNMELYGKSGATIYGPHVKVNRSTGNMTIGATFANGYRLSVDGKIMCEELRVNMSESWPDYVFHKDYSLLPVEDLGEYISRNGHLPNIPAANEIENTGLEVGKMQKLMMEKIEELSLYIVDQQKQIKELKEQIQELKSK